MSTPECSLGCGRYAHDRKAEPGLGYSACPGTGRQPAHECGPRFYVSLPIDVHDEVRRRAGDELRSMSNQVAYMLRDYITRNGQK